MKFRLVPDLHLEKDRGFGDTIARFTQWIRVPTFLKKITPGSIKKRLPKGIGRLDLFAEYFSKRVLKRDSCGCKERQKVWNTMYPYARLTISLPHRNDWEGIWATIHDLIKDIKRAGLQKKVEILVVDQSPELNKAPNAERNGLEVFCINTTKAFGIQVRYSKYEGTLGSSHAKQWGIRNKDSFPWVLTLDCHVSLEEGSLKRTFEFLKKNYTSKDMYNGVLILDDYAEAMTHLDLWEERKSPWSRKIPKIGQDLLWGKWGTPKPEAMNPKAKPVEIEAAGGWCMLTRKDSFPGYSPWLVGFGCEEGYTHEAVRRAGNKVMLLPPLRGWHRFNRTHPVDYGPDEQTIRNHAKSWVALGFDIKDLRESFVKIRDPEWIDDQFALALQEVREFPEKAIVQARELKFKQLVETPSDINEHLPVLRQMAEQVQHVTEFGTREGVSTTAFLAAQPAILHTYDIVKNCKCKGLENISGNCILKYHAGPKSGDTLKIEIEPTDILFIDTLHTKDQVLGELNRHADKVRELIIFHDTQSFGEWGEGHTSEKPIDGILKGIGVFLQENAGEWKVVADLKNNNGLMVIQRLPKLSELVQIQNENSPVKVPVDGEMVKEVFGD